jgi:hypothetical protein
VESRVRAQSVKPRFYFEKNDAIRALPASFLQPDERLIPLGQSGVDQGDIVGRDRNRRAASEPSPPGVQRLSYLHNLAQVISVVIGDQQNLAKIRPSFAVRNLSRQIQIPILDKFDDRS